MRAVTETGSKRKLTSRRLIVDWNGYKTLIFTMTKLQMRKVFAGAKTITIQGKQQINFSFEKIANGHNSLKFSVRLGKILSIGCESFTKDEVKELRKWCKQ